MRPLLVVIALFFPTVLHAQDLSQYRRVLLPAVTAGPIEGIAGSMFSAGYDVYSGTRCGYFPADDPRKPGEFGLFGPWPERPFLRIEPGVRPQARFLFIHNECFDSATFAGFVQTPGGRTALPTPKDDDFTTGITQLLGIYVAYTNDECTFGCYPHPVEIPVYRHTVRIYNSAYDGGGEVNVRLFLTYGGPGGARVQQYRVRLDRRDGDDPSFPYYGEVYVENICVRQNLHGCLTWLGRIEVEPVTDGLRYWAFATSTDNQTHSVVVSAPRSRN